LKEGGDLENNLVGFLKRAAEKTGFNRESYVEKNTPTISDNIVVVPFFGDLRSTFILSSLLLKPYAEQHKKYIILCSWPGFQGWFPYVSEYWSIKDNTSLQTLALGANNFYNTSNLTTDYIRAFNQQFENVLTYDDWQKFYKNGLTKQYRDAFEIKRYLPEVYSLSKLNDVFRHDLARRVGPKVMVYPSKQVRSWRMGRLEYVTIQRDFWRGLLNRLLDEKIVPVIYQNQFTYDLSQDFTERCVWMSTPDVSQVTCAMRATDCVLDFHSGISRMAIAARTPFVCIDERIRYIEHKEYEIDDLCSGSLPRQYSFSFSSLVTEGAPSEWDGSVNDGIIFTLKKFLPTLNRNNWPSTAESYEPVSYDNVRDWKARRMGIRFLKKY
jgi:hypothetical protein